MNELRLRLKQLTATQTIIAINILVYIVAVIIATFVGYGSSLLIMGAMEPGFVLSGEVWRLLTAAFLHAENPLHIILNMYIFWQIGLFVERFYGSRKVVVTYVVGAIVASLFSFAYAIIRFMNGDNELYISVGASGAIFALLGLLLGSTFKNRRYGIQLPIDSNQLLIIIGVNLLLGFALPNIDNAAHIGGLLAGVVLAYILEQNLTFSLTPWKNWFINIAFPISVALIMLSFVAQAFTIGLAAL